LLTNETKSKNSDLNLIVSQIKISNNKSEAVNETKIECVLRNLTENEVSEKTQKICFCFSFNLSKIKLQIMNVMSFYDLIIQFTFR